MNHEYRLNETERSRSYSINHPSGHVVNGQIRCCAGAPCRKRLKDHRGILTRQPAAAKVWLGIHSAWGGGSEFSHYTSESSSHDRSFRQEVKVASREIKTQRRKSKYRSLTDRIPARRPCAAHPWGSALLHPTSACAVAVPWRQSPGSPINGEANERVDSDENFSANEIAMKAK